jgi:tetratricopeptide (TPR) repeat protein
LSRQYAQRALAIYEMNFGPESMTLNQALIHLALAEIMLGRYADAESNLNRVLSLLAAGSKVDGPDAVGAYSSLGLLYCREGRYLEAERSYHRAGAIRRSGPDSGRDLANLARVYIATARYDKAETACLKALNLLTSLVGPDHDEVAAVLQILAQVRRGQKRHTEEMELLKDALDMTIRVSGPNHLNESIILTSIGVSQASRGRYGEAEGAFRKAILIQEKLGGDARRDYSVTLHNLARACSKQGLYADALDAASRALALREGNPANDDPTLVDMMFHKAELLRRVHRKPEAAKLERAARQAKAERNAENPHQWMVDFRELQERR